MIRANYLRPTCRECGRTFDLHDVTDWEEWHFGHDCEVPEGEAASVANDTGKANPEVTR